jgi:hypothetical protein
VTDLYSFELADGIASGECPLCYAIAGDVRRWLDSFWREGRQSPEARRRFFASGGFCPRHAWLLHDLLAEHSGAAIADLYGHLAERDLATIDHLLAKQRLRKLAQPLRRQAQCAACTEEADALDRKTTFLLELLATETGARGYERSCGLCYTHLVMVLDAAGDDDPVARFLLAEWRRRLEELRDRLAVFDRTRDYRYAAERTASDERSWTDVIHHYVGPPR